MPGTGPDGAAVLEAVAVDPNLVVLGFLLGVCLFYAGLLAVETLLGVAGGRRAD